MLNRKLDKLYRLQTKLYDSLIITENSGADPEIISIRTNDLECDIAKVKKEIDFEESIKPFVYMLIFFVVFTLVILSVSLFNIYI
jgi:hypothetical protein